MYVTDFPYGLCPVAPSERQECGYYGITKKECLSKTCCWDSTVPNTKWCFKQPGELNLFLRWTALSSRFSILLAQLTDLISQPTFFSIAIYHFKLLSLLEQDYTLCSANSIVITVYAKGTRSLARVYACSSSMYPTTFL